MPAPDLPRLVAALGGSPGDDLVGLVVANAAMIVRCGEATWVRSLGLTPEIATWF